MLKNRDKGKRLKKIHEWSWIHEQTSIIANYGRNQSVWTSFHCYVFVPLLELGEMPSCAVWWRATTVQAVATLLIIDTATLKWIVVSAFLDFFWPSQRCWLGFGVMLLPHGGIGLGSRWKEALTKENGLIMVNSFLFSFVSRCLAFVALIMLGCLWCFMFQMKCCIECLLDIFGSREVLGVNLGAFLEALRSTRTVAAAGRSWKFGVSALPTETCFRCGIVFLASREESMEEPRNFHSLCC